MVKPAVYGRMPTFSPRIVADAPPAIRFVTQDIREGKSPSANEKMIIFVGKEIMFLTVSLFPPGCWDDYSGKCIRTDETLIKISGREESQPACFNVLLKDSALEFEVCSEERGWMHQNHMEKE